MAYKIIELMGKPTFRDDDETVAVDAAIVPGHLLLETATGWVKNTANAANVGASFALGRDELGKTIDTQYAAGDQLKIGVFAPGQHVYAFLASGQNVARGAFLTGDNAGLLTATGVTATIRIAKALEAVNATGAAQVAGAGTRIRVEIV